MGTASADGTVRLWDCGSELCERAVLRGHSGPVLRLVFSPEGGELATCSEDGSARIWRQSPATSSEQSAWRPESVLLHATEVFTCLYSPTGNRLITACKDNSCRIWSRNDKYLKCTSDKSSGTQ